MSTSEELRKLWAMDPEEPTSWPFAQDWREAGGDIMQLPIWPDGKALVDCTSEEIMAARAYHQEAGRRAHAEADELERLSARLSGKTEEVGEGHPIFGPVAVPTPGAERYMTLAESGTPAEQAINTRLEEIEVIYNGGGVAVVFHEPVGPAMEALARSHGWPERPVKAMGAKMRAQLAAVDPATSRFVLRPHNEVLRVVLFIHKGSMLLNYHEARGWWIEPGSTDGLPS